MGLFSLQKKMGRAGMQVVAEGSSDGNDEDDDDYDEDEEDDDEDDH